MDLYEALACALHSAADHHGGIDGCPDKDAHYALGSAMATHVVVKDAIEAHVAEVLKEYVTGHKQDCRASTLGYDDACTCGLSDILMMAPDG
jgi:hypothetical protein